MKRQKVMERILQTIEMGKEGIDLIDKVLNLKSTDQNVHSIELYYGTVNWKGLSAIVLLLEDFPNSDEFQKYVNKNLKKQISLSNKDERNHYVLYEHGIKIEFYKPAYYSYCRMQ